MDGVFRKTQGWVTIDSIYLINYFVFTYYFALGDAFARNFFDKFIKCLLLTILIAKTTFAASTAAARINLEMCSFTPLISTGNYAYHESKKQNSNCFGYKMSFYPNY